MKPKYPKRPSEDFGVEHVNDGQSRKGRYAGKVDLRNNLPVQIREDRTRTYIVLTLLAMLVLCSGAGIVAFFIRGDMEILRLVIPMLTNSLTFALGYYFGSKQRKRKGRRDK